MNCRQFQSRLHEYVEGSLSASAQAAANAHCEGCNYCRQAFERERQFANYVFNRIRQDTSILVLRPEIRERVIASPILNKRASAPQLWRWLVWPTGIAAALILAASLRPANRPPGAPPRVTVQLSYRGPALEFHRQGNLLVDALSYETVVASGTLPSELHKKAPSLTQSKTPL